MVSTAIASTPHALDRRAVDHERDSGHGSRTSVTHLAFGTLVDYVRGLGTPAAREQVHRHLSSCVGCNRSVTGLARFADIAYAEMDCHAPEEVVDEAISLFSSEPSDRRALSDVNSVFFARSRRAASGGECQPVGGRRQRFLRFKAAISEIDVDLLIIEENQVVSVAGQITTRKKGRSVDGRVSAHRGSDQRPIAQTRASDGGLFLLSYDSPAAAVLAFLIPGNSATISVRIDIDSVADNC